MSRRSPGFVVSLTLAFAGMLVVSTPLRALAGELAIAEGTVAISAPAAGQRAPACGELVVEARDALDSHLIGRTRPEAGADGACRYAISVPAQSAVWLRLRPALVASARVTQADFSGAGLATAGRERAGSARSVALRFTVLAPSTYFFAPGERKTVPLSY
jgi:hypothetical protein